MTKQIKLFFSVSGTESGNIRGKSRGALASVSHDDHQMAIAEINRNSKIKYFDGSGEDVTPVPLFVPPEPVEEELDVDDDSSKRKPRKSVMQTFLKVLLADFISIIQIK